ncbi:hypothetical protein ACMD2_20653, partial [Ananas comosus]
IASPTAPPPHLTRTPLRRAKPLPPPHPLLFTIKTPTPSTLSLPLRHRSPSPTPTLISLSDTAPTCGTREAPICSGLELVVRIWYYSPRPQHRESDRLDWGFRLPSGVGELSWCAIDRLRLLLILGGDNYWAVVIPFVEDLGIVARLVIATQGDHLSARSQMFDDIQPLMR